MFCSGTRVFNSTEPNRPLPVQVSPRADPVSPGRAGSNVVRRQPTHLMVTVTLDTTTVNRYTPDLNGRGLSPWEDD